MWRAVNSDGTLTYSFIESVEASYAGYVVRFIGGGIFFAGMLVMAWNIWKTREMALAEGVSAQSESAPAREAIA